jgi:hypothetical protein
MSKKKRKTKAEKAQPKNYDFKTPVYKIEKSKEKTTQTNGISKNNPEIDPRVIFDLRKVGIIIGLMLVLILVVTYLVYKTDLLNPILAKLGISY